MTEYKDEDNDNICDWCGEPNHDPSSCPDIVGKAMGSFRRALTKRRLKKKK